ncbi:MAG TPA: hypothetical protein P5260_15860 [Candidatus Competibacter sp.]|nr:hypothetical protein [Candidatus Competibacter sp.]HRX62671.1 hypothetical protein [Candidatus Competibacter sp.]
MSAIKYGLKTAWAVSIGIVVFAGTPQAHAERWVVIDAENAPLPLGAWVEDGQAVTLVAGARLTLLTEAGQTLQLTGPYSGVPGGSASTSAAGNNLPVLAKFLQGHQQATTALGVSRGEAWSELDAPPAADLVNADHSGERCLIRDPVVLWRQDAAPVETVTLADAEGRSLADLTWPAGAAQLAIPGPLFADGQHYRLRRGSRQVDLYVHKASLHDNPAALAAWMVNRGCKIQALILLKEL